MSLRLVASLTAPALASALAVASLMVAPAAHAQITAQPSGTEGQRQAIAALDILDGEWRGQATIYGPGGATTLTQTERVGSLLGGSIKVIEGRGYAADGQTQFNAFGIVSWDDRAGKYSFRAYANGHSGEYPFERTADGFRWEMPAGPNARIKYTATVIDGRWREVAEYVADGQPPRRAIVLDLQRVGDTTWPSAGAVSPTP